MAVQAAHKGDRSDYEHYVPFQHLLLRRAHSIDHRGRAVALAWEDNQLADSHYTLYRVLAVLAPVLVGPWRTSYEALVSVVVVAD